MAKATADRRTANAELWLPAQVRLRPHPAAVGEEDGQIEDFDLSDMGDDPIAYFLTPAPSSDDEDFDAMDIDYDAGIEDAKHPPRIVRSISPSNLEGLARPPPRPPTPPRSPGTPPTPELEMLGGTPDDDDGEEYVRFAGALRRPLDRPFGLEALAAAASARANKQGKTADALLSANSAPLRLGVRPLHGVSAGGWTRGLPTRPSPRAWREPSPDVWSIEEETVEELDSDLGPGVSEEENNTGHRPRKTKAIDIPAAKPKKKVRFVLPAREQA
jgi:hypothetical protein